MLMLVVVVMIPFIKVMMVFTKLMMMQVLVMVLTFPEQSLQDMPPVPRHLWHAFTTPVCGTVTTLTCHITTVSKNIMIIIAIGMLMSTSSLNILAGGSSISHGSGAPPRPGPSTSPP